MKPLVILKLGTTTPETMARHGDCDQWMIRAIGDSPLPLQSIDILGGAALPAIEDCAGAILTGSGAMVTERQPWSEATRAWLQQAVPAGLPVFGVCYGHQLLADAFGGEVAYHPQGLEIGHVTLERQSASDHDPLFADLPAHFSANATHYQSVLRLPDDATLLLSNAHDPHHAFRLGQHAWGVQFHPEFDTCIMGDNISRKRERLASEGHDADALLAALCPTPQAAALLSRFAHYVASLGRHEKISQQ
ncbi:MAG: glutamine amidotransferase [Cardiobacteriaceae bacterium]|nr:glutamine amidotransferase [Cardiobacteriaceae bacterium]